MINRDHSNNIWSSNIDWVAVILYLILVFTGWLNIYSAVNNGSESALFDIGTRYGMQFIWIIASMIMGVVVLLVDSRFYYIFAYVFYWAAIAILVVVLIAGKEVKGAKSWIRIGSIAFQPTELAKFTTALALARGMSQTNFSLSNPQHIVKAMAILALPFMIIILQNDTGSALVYGGFLVVLYREGLNSWIYGVLIAMILIFITSFLFTPLSVLLTLILVCLILDCRQNPMWQIKIIYGAWITLIAIAIYMIVNLICGGDISVYMSLLISSLIMVVPAIIYAYKNRLINTYKYIALFVGSIIFSKAIDYTFNTILQPHQRIRILHLLGLEYDPRGAGYNVNQSMIAIGSGGLSGKGFLNGTQTRYNFVPEQSTDFIFSTIGEEWGFIGAFVIISLFCWLILRLIKMGELQTDKFSRVYCYSAAGIFFIHVVINIGMTIGLMPVIGIPLPFFSYGGSSLLAFSLLYLVAVKMDSMRRESIRR